MPDAIRILVVDDHGPVRLAISSLLRSQPDFEVIGEAADGVSAVESANRLQPDVIVLDIAMPGMNGYRAAKQIRALAPSSNIVFLSQYDTIQAVREAFQTGGCAYVAKSDAAHDLVPAIRAASVHRRYVDQKFAAVLREAI